MRYDWMTAAAVVMGCCLAAESVSAGLIISKPSGPFVDATCDCPPFHTPGYTRLLPLSWLSAEQISLNWYTYWSQIDGEYPSEWYYRFPQESDPDVSADVTVQSYQALHVSKDTLCIHKAHFDVQVDHVSNLPAGQTFGWVQLCRSTGDALFTSIGDTPGWNIDPDTRLTIYADTEDSAPFYYNAKDMTDYWAEGHLPYTPDDPDTPAVNEQMWWFHDRPSAPNPEAVAHAGSAEFLLMLVSWDGVFLPGDGGDNSHPITIYGGFDWGYRFECVPEPASFALLASGGLILFVRRH